MNATTPGRLLPWALVTPALAVDARFLRAAVHRDGRAQPARTWRRRGDAGKLPAVFQQSELLARAGQFARSDADGDGDLRAARLSLCLDTRGGRAASACSGWRWCSPSCPSGPPMSCAPTAGCWCWPRTAWSTGADRLGPDRRAAAARQHAHGDRHRLRAFLRHAADADHLRQSEAALARAIAAPPPISAQGRSGPSFTSSCR